LDGKGAVFLLDSGIVGETAPMVTIFMENLKDKGFRTMLKKSVVKYTDACVEILWWRHEVFIMNTKKIIKRSFE
jgi:mevalonate kinase